MPWRSRCRAPHGFQVMLLIECIGCRRGRRFPNQGFGLLVKCVGCRRRRPRFQDQGARLLVECIACLPNYLNPCSLPLPSISIAAERPPARRLQEKPSPDTDAANKRGIRHTNKPSKQTGSEDAFRTREATSCERLGTEEIMPQRREGMLTFRETPPAEDRKRPLWVPWSSQGWSPGTPSQDTPHRAALCRKRGLRGHSGVVLFKTKWPTWRRAKSCGRGRGEQEVFAHSLSGTRTEAHLSLSPACNICHKNRRVFPSSVHHLTHPHPANDPLSPQGDSGAAAPRVSNGCRRPGALSLPIYLIPFSLPLPSVAGRKAHPTGVLLRNPAWALMLRTSKAAGT
ncbi:uncharacterized protein LOC130298394 [Hyla sarda]|uniref:uncharacterized protein LOC130298394 n=1 Tax=Hyla sarda TaxID=327740 RepID=UPI0024C3140D|nr:uncharacterized protein LOC130298394 [Hyla sarda]